VSCEPTPSNGSFLYATRNWTLVPSITNLKTDFFWLNNNVADCQPWLNELQQHYDEQLARIERVSVAEFGWGTPGYADTAFNIFNGIGYVGVLLEHDQVGLDDDSDP
jgi:hypothetical protein